MLICEWFKWMDISSFARVGCVVLSDLGLYGGHWLPDLQLKIQSTPLQSFSRKRCLSYAFPCPAENLAGTFRFLGNCKAGHEHVYNRL
jgi:hypothetical protein